MKNKILLSAILVAIFGTAFGSGWGERKDHVVPGNGYSIAHILLPLLGKI